MSRECSVVRRTIDTPDDFIEVIPFGDLHWGSPQCDKEQARGYLDWVMARPNRYIVLMGDLIENSTRQSVGAGVYEQIQDPQEQIDDVLDLLEPVRDRILCMVTGNHEERTYKQSGVDVSQNMARTLGVPYLRYGGYLRLVVNGVGYTGYITHGAAGSVTITGKRNAITKLLKVAPDADFYMMGHVHLADVWHEEPLHYNTRNNTSTTRRQTYVLTGHFLNYEGGYGQMKNYPPGRVGVPRLRFDGNEKDLHGSI